VTLLKENKILVLDFCSWVKDELAKIPAKPRGRQAGSGKGTKSKSDPSVRLLVSVLSGLAPNETPRELLTRLKNLVEDEQKTEQAVRILEEKESEHGRKNGFIQLRVRTKGQGKIKVKK
jgi:hypothetical protein